MEFSHTNLICAKWRTTREFELQGLYVEEILEEERMLKKEKKYINFQNLQEFS